MKVKIFAAKEKIFVGELLDGNEQFTKIQVIDSSLAETIGKKILVNNRDIEYLIFQEE